MSYEESQYKLVVLFLSVVLLSSWFLLKKVCPLGFSTGFYVMFKLDVGDPNPPKTKKQALFWTYRIFLPQMIRWDCYAHRQLGCGFYGWQDQLFAKLLQYDILGRFWIWLRADRLLVAYDIFKNLEQGPTKFSAPKRISHAFFVLSIFMLF